MPDDSTIIAAAIAATLVAVGGLAYGAYRLLNVLFISRAERSAELKQLGEKIDALVAIAMNVKKDLEHITDSVDRRFEHLNSIMQSDHQRLNSEMLRLEDEIKRTDDRIRGDGHAGSGVLTRLDAHEQSLRAAHKRIDALKS